MNFFGHCVLAGWQDPRPEFCFGSMWPDFAGMLRHKAMLSADPTVTSGIVFHHRVDAVFHNSEHFLHFQRESRVTLAASGLPKGPTRALAHVGVELLLDAALSHDPDARTHYSTALMAADPTAMRNWLPDLPETGHQDFEQLRLRLLQRIADNPPETPELLTERLLRILAGRPRLALPFEHRTSVTRWLTELEPHIAITRDAWRLALLAALACRDSKH